MRGESERLVAPRLIEQLRLPFEVVPHEAVQLLWVVNMKPVKHPALWLVLFTSTESQAYICDQDATMAMMNASCIV